MVYSFRRVGTETRINTTIDGNEVGGQFTRLSDGRYISTWVDRSTQSGQPDRGLFQQIFDSNMNRIGDAIRVNTTTGGEIWNPAVVALPGGRWATTWQPGDQENQSNEFIQIFDRNGRVGGETRVNDSLRGVENTGEIVELAGGGFVVLWEGEGTRSGQEDADNGIFFQRYDATGTKVGGETRINTSTDGNQSGSRVIELAGGTFGVVWSGIGTQTGQEDQNGIYLQRFDSNWNPIGTETRVNAAVEQRPEYYWYTANLSDGGWVMTYYVSQSSARTVWQQVFNADGTKRGGEIKIAPGGDSGIATSPRVHPLSDGKWIAFWNEGPSTDASDLYYQVYKADGSVLGPKTLATASTDGRQSRLGIWDLPDGGFLFLWEGKGTQLGQEDADGGYFFQRFDSNGNKVGGETRINTSTEGPPKGCDLEVLPTGHIVFVWEGKGTQPGQEDEVGLFQQIFDADGNRVGGETRIATSTAGTQRWTDITDLEDGSWIVQWQGNGTQPGQEDPHDSVNNTGGGLFFQRFELTNTLTGTSGKNKLTGGMLDDFLYGLKGNDTLDGGLGDDVLKGGDGKDVLYGRAGKDTFVFDTKLNVKTNLDSIKDYAVADDTIWLDNKIFTKLGKKGTEAAPALLNKNFFKVTTKAAAKDKNDYVFYNKKTGKLYYDKDGSGIKYDAVQIASLTKNLKLTFEDFFVI